MNINKPQIIDPIPKIIKNIGTGPPFIEYTLSTNPHTADELRSIPIRIIASPPSKLSLYSSFTFDILQELLSIILCKLN